MMDVLEAIKGLNRSHEKEMESVWPPKEFYWKYVSKSWSVLVYAEYPNRIKTMEVMALYRAMKHQAEKYHVY